MRSQAIVLTSLTLTTRHLASYTPLKPRGKRKSKTTHTIALKTNFTIDSIIMYSLKNGLAFDSCWRNKNENRAPLSLMIVVDDHHHLIPGRLSSQLRWHFLTEVFF